MRQRQRIPILTELVTDSFQGDDQDVADAICDDDDSFIALAERLDDLGGGTAEGITQVWNELVENLTDNDLDFIADKADNPAAYLISRL